MSASHPTHLRMYSIEAGRGVAASLVVLYHASRHLDKDLGYAAAKAAFQFGHAGVDFFFVISGFIILFVHGSDIGRPERLGHYAFRRVTRIFPVYWTILAITVAAAALSPHQASPSLAQVAMAVTLLPTEGESLVGVAWTLQHEMIFYLLFACLIVNFRVGLSLFILWVAAIALAPFSGFSISPGKLVSGYNLEFFLGMAAAQTVRRGDVPLAGLALFCGVAGFSLAATAEVTGLMDGYQGPARLAYGLPSALVILGLAGLERSGRIPVPAPFRWLGSASYSIYLFHLLCIGLFYKLWSAVGLLDKAPREITFLAIAAAGILGGIAVSRTVEYPVMRLIRNHGRLAARTAG